MKNYFYLLMFLYSSLLFSQDEFFERYIDNATVPEKLLKKVMSFYQQNKDKIKNKRYVGIIDFKMHNSKERLFVVDLEGNRIESFLVAHGKNSDPDFDGYATTFSNTLNSNQSSLGFYLTGETYFGQHGYSMRLDGISASNSNARERAIVVHAADYVFPGEKIGRSFGCPAIEERYNNYLIDRLKDGALLYASYE